MNPRERESSRSEHLKPGLGSHARYLASIAAPVLPRRRQCCRNRPPTATRHLPPSRWAPSQQTRLSPRLYPTQNISPFYLLWPCTSRPIEAHCPHGLTASATKE